MSGDQIAAADDAGLVHDLVGPPLTGVQAGAAIGLGIVSLLLSGFLPILLGALADEHRLTVSDIGVTAMLEALVTGLTTGLAGAFLHPRRLKLIAAVASLLLVALDLAMLGAHGQGVLALRAVAGVPDGLLLWITIAMIARTTTPERWAGVLLTTLTLAQVVLAAACTVFVVPRFHADGGFLMLALVTVSGVACALFTKDSYAPLPGGGDHGPPPPRGWIALFGTTLFVAAPAAVSIYALPLAHQAGLSAEVGGLSVSVYLGMQVVGGTLATLVAGRVRYFTVFVGCSTLSLIAWVVYLFWPPAWLFIGAAALMGIVTLFAAPFIVPMTIEADPSLKAAVQSGGAQLLGGALGPLMASLVVGERDVHGAVLFGAALLLSGLAVIAGLHFTARRER